MYLTTLLKIALLTGLKVFKSKAHTREETLNELTAMLIMYSVFLFTDYVSDVNVKFILGYLFSVFILVHLIFNIVIIIQRSISLNIKHLFIKNELKKKQKKNMAMREAREIPLCKTYAENRRKFVARHEKRLE